jgi:hypothetical protein
LFGSKCGKTHLRASVKSKNFPGATYAPGPPRKRRKGRAGEEKAGEGEVEGTIEEWGGKEGKGKGGGGRRKGEGGEKRGKGRAGKWKERELERSMRHMVFGGIYAPDVRTRQSADQHLYRLVISCGRRLGVKIKYFFLILLNANCS